MQISKAMQEVMAVRGHQLNLGFDTAHDVQINAGGELASLAHLLIGEVLDSTSETQAPWPVERAVHMREKYDDRELLLHVAAILVAEVERRDAIDPPRRNCIS